MLRVLDLWRFSKVVHFNGDHDPFQKPRVWRKSLPHVLTKHVELKTSQINHTFNFCLGEKPLGQIWSVIHLPRWVLGSFLAAILPLFMNIFTTLNDWVSWGDLRNLMVQSLRTLEGQDQERSRIKRFGMKSFVVLLEVSKYSEKWKWRLVRLDTSVE